MKFKESYLGVTLLFTKGTQLYNLLNEIFYGKLSDKNKDILAKMFKTTLGAAGLLDFQPQTLRAFRTQGNNLVILVPRYETLDTPDKMLEFDLDEFTEQDEAKILELCELYLKLRPYLDN